MMLEDRAFCTEIEDMLVEQRQRVYMKIYGANLRKKSKIWG